MNLSNCFDNFNSLNNFNLIPKASDRTAYNTIPNDIKELIQASASTYKDFTPPQILASHYLQYTKIGDRVNFESLYFTRRKALAALVLAECVEYENTYLEKIIDLVVLICEESGWQLPAHNNYVRNTPSLPFPDKKRPVLDLFALETSALLATTIYLLDEKLKEFYPYIIERVYEELDFRIIKPYLNYDFWWMGKGERTLNWTVWCTQNMLLTTHLLDFQSDTKLDISKKALFSLQAFLNDYDEDGCCDEGAQYFRLAGLCLFNSINILNNISNNSLDFVFTDTKVRNIANYIKNVHIQDKYFFNFADCSAICDYCGTREYLFAKAIEDKELTNFILNQHSNTEHIDLPEEYNLFIKVQSVFTSIEMRKQTINTEITYQDIYYPSVGLFIARDSLYTLAVKGGHNNDNHNHNDTGSFTIFKNGKPFVIDIGVENYNAKTFSPRRYEIWTMQSSYHNLPDFDETMQMDGENYCATNTTTSFDKETASISMELKNAYPEHANLHSFNRSVTLNRNNNIIISDNISGTFSKVVSNLIFWNKPQIVENKIVTAIGSISISNFDSAEVEEIFIDDSRLKATWGDYVYRVKISHKSNLELIVN